jgi:hypothetical protein
MQSIDLSGSVKDEKFFDQMSDCQLLREGFDLRSTLI